MASSLLSQMQFIVPSQYPPKNLAFSAAVSLRVSSISSGSYLVSISERAKNCSLVVRAEVKTDAEVEVLEESAENVGLLQAYEGSESISEGKPPRQSRIRLGDIMGGFSPEAVMILWESLRSILNKRAVEASDAQRPIPELKTGDIVEIKLEVPENRKRLSVYKGIIISRQNAGIHTTIRVRRIIAGVGVEIVFPIYSPNIREIRVVSHRKVRRARLYYLRDKLPRLSTFK